MIKEIVVNSIFEGLMPSALFGADNQYLMGIGIDPDVPLTDEESDIKTGGAIRPVQYSRFSGNEIDAAPVAIINTPQSDLTWVILTNGKIVVYKDSLNSSSALSVGQVEGNQASGAFYLNNYIYVLGTGADHDDVSRIGPLNALPFELQTSPFTLGQVITGQVSGATALIVGFDVPSSPSVSPSPSHSTSASESPSASVSPSASASPSVGLPEQNSLILSQISGIFSDGELITGSGGSGSATVVSSFVNSLITNNVWKGPTLGNQGQLGNFPYPKTLLDISYLNHFGFAHSDGAGYFLDYKDGKGLIHKIQTKKGTFQGELNDGSAYGSVGDLSLPFDFVPITAVSYGTDIVISGSKTLDSTVNQGNASLFFWDGAEELFYRIVPLSEPICSVLKYVNGILYGLSGDLNGGYRLFRYVGGDTVEYLEIIEDGNLPLQMASDHVGNRLVWAANTALPTISSGLYGYGSKSDLFPRGLHHIALSEFV